MFKFLKKKHITISSFKFENDCVSLLFPLYNEYFPKYILTTLDYYYLSNKCDIKHYEENFSYKQDFKRKYPNMKNHNSNNYVNSLLTIYSKLSK
jgi:hypothetical protein